MNKETLEGIPNTEVSTQAISVVRENLPEWFKENLWDIVQVCIDNEDWSERLVEKDQTELLFTNDIVHDVRGLLQDDEHFLPRI
jgi:hypothetical protein